MKKLIFTFLFLLSICSMYAIDFTVNGINYSTLTDSKVQVSFVGSYTGSIAIPATVTYKNVTYSVTSIGNRAFIYCTGLTSITIPASVTSIGDFAFNGCTSLTSIYTYAATPVYLDNNIVFYNVNKSTCTLYVSTGSKALYQAADQLKDFKNIVEFTTATPMINAENIKLFPNPILDNLSINGIEGKARVTIIDINGRTLLSKEITSNENIAVGTLRKGLYIVKLITDDGVIEKKMVKK